MGFHLQFEPDLVVLLKPGGGAAVPQAKNRWQRFEHEFGARLLAVAPLFCHARLRSDESWHHRPDEIGGRLLREAEHSLQCPCAGAGGHADVQARTERRCHFEFYRHQATARRRADRPAQRFGCGGSLFYVRRFEVCHRPGVGRGRWLVRVGRTILNGKTAWTVAHLDITTSPLSSAEWRRGGASQEAL